MNTPATKPTEPSQFRADAEIYEIASVLDQRYEPDATYFKVQSTEGKTYLLRYDDEDDEWTLQSGFDGAELSARPIFKAQLTRATKTDRKLEARLAVLEALLGEVSYQAGPRR